MKKAVKKAVKRKNKKTSRTSSLIKRPRGISKVVVLAVVAGVLALAGGFYVFGMRGNSGGGIPFVQKALNPNCELKDPELCKFMNNWQVQRNYTVTTTGEFDGMKIESTYEIAGEDKFHSVSKQGGKEVSNMISIDDTMYTLDYTDNKWWKMTTKVEELEESAEEMKDTFDFDAEAAEDNTTYKFIAKEACGDRMCFKYEIISPDSEGTKQFIWFDDKEYLTRKMLVEMAEGGSSESVFSYGGVNISTPSPVKEGNPYGASGAAPSEEEIQKMMQQYKQDSSQVEETQESAQESFDAMYSEE